jgi:dienelactone hydrolase
MRAHVKTRDVYYEEAKVRFKGFMALPTDEKKKAAAVLICHAWHGQDELSRRTAKALAGQGYVGFAVDMYGEGKHATSSEEAAQLMTPLLHDRALIRRRLAAALQAVRQQAEVDPALIGATGFCFGGACALELARSGADIRAVVTFHANLTRQQGLKSGPLKAAILVLHGHEDPLVPQRDVLAFQQEMHEAKADWQMVIFGNALHGFMDPESNTPQNGLQYNKRVADRAWKVMELFFHERLASAS